MSESTPERRKQILCAAERLFKHYGFGKTTVADIAREAGVGVGTVYLEFPSKDTIIAELTFESHAGVLDAMRKAAAGPGSHAERLRNLLDQRIKCIVRLARDGQHGMDLVRCACAAARSAYERFRALEEDLLTELIDAACAAGEFAAASPRSAARVIIRLHDSFAHSAAQDGTIKHLRRELATAHDLVLAGLQRRPG
jgi:AcrR family transcriptional regulator